MKAIPNIFKSMLIMVFMTGMLSYVYSQEVPVLKIVFAGDIMGHDSQIESALKQGEGKYDYSSCFKYIQPYISSADIAIGNLEVTLAGAPYKGYPAFSSPDELAIELKKAGFDILVNANNHAIDRRKAGLERTKLVLDTLGIVQTGVFTDSLERALEYPLIVEKNNIRLALLNYTYGTNGIKVTAPNIVNYIDTLEVKEDLVKVATARPDFIIAMMHWGLEYERTPNAKQKQLAAFLLENGVDAIIGSHPHVVQPIEMIEKKNLVVWSTGNMISNQRKRYTDGGILVDITLKKTDSTRLIDYNYLPVWVHKPVNSKGPAFSLKPAAIEESYWEKLNISASDGKSMQLFLKDTRENISDIPEVDWKTVLPEGIVVPEPSEIIIEADESLVR